MSADSGLDDWLEIKPEHYFKVGVILISFEMNKIYIERYMGIVD